MRIWSESTARENHLPISRHTSSKTEMIRVLKFKDVYVIINIDYILRFNKIISIFVGFDTSFQIV